MPAPPRPVRIIRVVDTIHVLTRRGNDGGAVPYFFWDRAIALEELHRILADPHHPERLSTVATLLREARPDEVWLFMSPDEVSAILPELLPRLGRQRSFWNWLLGAWREIGLLD